MILSKGQRHVLKQLRLVAEIALDKERFKHLPIQPRTHSLICGPSGVGKSHLCRALAKDLGTSVMVLNCSSWQPNGSRSELHTWEVVAGFINDHAHGIIVLDEIDKINGSSEWNGYIRLEIHDLLDGVIPAQTDLPDRKLTREEAIEKKKKDDSIWEENSGDFTWGDDDSEKVDREHLEQKLKDNFMIVGAGAWQHLWEMKDRPTMGFTGSSETPMKEPSQEQIRTSIYPEVLKRFRSEILIIPPMTESDYREAAKATVSSISETQARRFRNQFEKNLKTAIKTQQGMRWFEELLLDAFTHKPTPPDTHAHHP